MPRYATEKSKQNLIPIRDSERARELAKRSAEAKKRKAQQREMLHQDIGDTITAEMAVPASIYEPLKKYGIRINKKERIDKVLFFRGLLKAIKDGNIDTLLKVAEFAGFKDITKLELSGTIDNNLHVTIEDV